jgi:tetratricopeptide (TPR) repeat protein
MDLKAQHKLKKASEFESQHKYLHAIQIYHSLMEEYPEYPEPFIKLAELYEHTGNAETALSVYEKIIHTQPDYIDLQLAFSQFLIRNKLWDMAIETLIRISPEDEPIISYFLGYTYYITKEYELAKINLLNFIISDEQPELIHEAYLYLAKTEYELGLFESASKYLSKAEMFFSNYWEVYLIRAKIRYQNNMPEHAAIAVEKALKLNEKESSVHFWAGKIYLNCRDFGKAEKHFKDYIDLCDEITSEDYSNLADVYYSADKFKEALNYFDKAIELDPENNSAVSGKINVANLLQKNNLR